MGLRSSAVIGGRGRHRARRGAFGRPNGALLLAVAIVATGSLPSAATASTDARAMWVWDGPDPAAIDLALERGVGTLFLSAPPGFSSDGRYGPFLAEAHAAGLVVYALAGDPSWAKRSRPLVRWTEEVVGFGAGDTRFDGLAPDVEPYLLADWNQRRKRDRLIGSYLSGLDRMVAAAEGMPVVPAVPFWWDLEAYRTHGLLLVDQVLRRTSGVAVMAYRDHALGTDGIVEHARTEVDLATSRGRLAWVGVQTAPDALDKLSFWEEGAAAMEAELASVAAAFAGDAGYAGIAVHHFGSYRDLAP